MSWFTKKKSPNYGKIIAISVACIAVASVVAFVIYKLVKKYKTETIYDDLLDDCDCIEESDDAE